MSIDSLKDYISTNFTPMAWDRIELKLIHDLSEVDQSKSVSKELFEKVHNALSAMYGSGLSKNLFDE